MKDGWYLHGRMGWERIAGKEIWQRPRAGSKHGTRPGRRGPALVGPCNSQVPSSRYSALPCDFGQIAKLAQLQFTKNVPVSKENPIPFSLGSVDFCLHGALLHYHACQSSRGCSHFRNGACYLLVIDASMPGTFPSYINTDTTFSSGPLGV